jgi:hypothetical protein
LPPKRRGPRLLLAMMLGVYGSGTPIGSQRSCSGCHWAIVAWAVMAVLGEPHWAIVAWAVMAVLGELAADACRRAGPCYGRSPAWWPAWSRATAVCRRIEALLERSWDLLPIARRDTEPAALSALAHPQAAGRSRSRSHFLTMRKPADRRPDAILVRSGRLVASTGTACFCTEAVEERAGEEAGEIKEARRVLSGLVARAVAYGFRWAGLARAAERGRDGRRRVSVG